MLPSRRRWSYSVQVTTCPSSPPWDAALSRGGPHDWSRSQQSARTGDPMTAYTPDGGGLTEAEREALVSRIKWNLDHFGPIRDDGQPYSRFESPAHAAADAVYDWLAARSAPDTEAVAAAWDEGAEAG